MVVFKVGELSKLRRWLEENKGGPTFSVLSRPKSTYGYLPKIVSSCYHVQVLFEDWEERDIDGDFDVSTYDGPMSVFVDEGGNVA